MAGKGIDLIRTWGFLNGAQDPYAVGVALQPSVGAALAPCSHVLPPHATSLRWRALLQQVGVFDELSLKRLDLVVSEAGKNGIYLILPLVNHWDDLGGMQWYVDQVRALFLGIDKVCDDRLICGQQPGSSPAHCPQRACDSVATQ
jgi:mannan endo-1,4-beta-mannosidase